MATRWGHTTDSFGRPFVDKPSFDGLPAESLNLAHASLLDADRAAADWEQLDLLFERNWFGPCSCLGSEWDSQRLDSVPSSDVVPTEDARLAYVDTPRIAHTTGGLLRLFQFLQPQADLAQQSLPNATSESQPTLYGLGAAPVPEPAFVSNLPQESSPQKAVPVPMRITSLAKDDAGDGHLPRAVAIEPPPATAAAVSQAAELVRAQPTPPGRSVPDDDAALAALGPQLGTWADRQYRLLDPVPERGECGPGSISGNSVPSSASNIRSPNTVTLGRNGGSGSGGCGSGSGEYSGAGGSSSLQTVSHVPPASPTLLDLLHKQKQEHVAEQFCGSDSQPRFTQAQGPDGLARGAVSYAQNGKHAVAVFSGALQERDVTTHPHERLQLQQQTQQTAAVDVAGRQVDTEALMQEAAWRWRFTRRWQAEQARAGPDQASSAPRDQMEEALAYLQATNATTTVSMQIANVSSRVGGSHGSGSRGGMSMDGSLALTSGMVGTLGAAASTLGGDCPLGACASGSGSFTSGPRILGRQASGELLAASREVASLNRRAAAVLQQQLDCEQQADRRVQESLGQGSPWVGHFIPIVQIDEWGSFRFLMLKLRDQSARGGGAPGGERQRILIRGHNYGSEGQLMEECSREILTLSHKHGLPFEAPTCMGGGVMEWRRDRDRHLHLHSGFVMDRALPMGMLPSGGAAGRPASATDLLNLAAALARQSFPPTYKITVLT